MADTPEDKKDEKPELLPFIQPIDAASPTVVALTGKAHIGVSAMGFSSFVYVPPSDGYAPDPHDDGDSSFVITGTTKPSRLPRVPRQVKEELDSCLTEADRLIDAIKHFLTHVDTASYSSPALVSPQLKVGWNNPLQKNPAKKPVQKQRQPQS